MALLLYAAAKLPRHAAGNFGKSVADNKNVSISLSVEKREDVFLKLDVETTKLLPIYYNH